MLPECRQAVRNKNYAELVRLSKRTPPTENPPAAFEMIASDPENELPSVAIESLRIPASRSYYYQGCRAKFHWD
jgi:hypothetical protein